MNTMLPRRRRGATAIEYGLIAGLVLIVALGFLTLTGVNLNNIFGGLGTNLSNANNPTNLGPWTSISGGYVNNTGLYVYLPTYQHPEIRPSNTGTSNVNIPIGSTSLTLVPGAQIDINWSGVSNPSILVDPYQSTSATGLAQENSIISTYCSKIGGTIFSYSGGTGCGLPSGYSVTTLTSNTAKAMGIPGY